MSVNTSLRQASRALWGRADQRWTQLDTREQKLLTGAGLLIAVVFVWLVLLDPAWTTLRKTRTGLPAAVAQAGQALQLAQTLQNLQGKARKPIVHSSDALAYLVRTLKQYGWTQKDAVLESAAGQLDVQLKAVAANDALAWLDDAGRQAGLKLGSVQMTKREAGKVDLKAQFRLIDGSP